MYILVLYSSVLTKLDFLFFVVILQILQPFVLLLLLFSKKVQRITLSCNTNYMIATGRCFGAIISIFRLKIATTF